MEKVGYLGIFECLMTLDIFSDCRREILTVIIFFNSSRKKVNIASVDVLGSTSGSSVDGSDDNIKNTGADLFGLFTLGKQHANVQYGSEIK